MSQKINVHYELNEALWRKFYDVYYAADKKFKLRFIYGTCSWILGVCGLLGFFENNILALGMIAFGLYCVFAKRYLVNRAVKKAVKKGHNNPQTSGEVDYTIDTEKITGVEQGLDFEFRWDSFYGYRDAAPGLLLYLKKATVLFIPDETISVTEKHEIVNILTQNKVQNLATK
ncbi:hypothetical protein SAMN05660420_00674 [Desulfuromusa kysingii]|uniref:YcxB-like protein n=1 Tax=Desulfuromusa kysingii TaxID=37625 RepID=A0A1H3WTU9_9BACT|nr:YcxB family protein [Desulfuromusa kysingii]SDZ90559.1 hypothetical protein SAMN05660420_00674 [Desulfuromusa kysingii]